MMLKRTNIKKTKVKTLGRLLTNEEVREIEQIEIKKIIEYMEYLKTTKAWTEEDGRFLLGFGNLIKEKPWVYTKVTKPKRNDRKAQIERFRASVMGEI